MITIVIIAGLYLLLSSVIYFILRKKTVSLSWQQCGLFLGAKIATGSLYGYVYIKYYGGDDTLGLNHDSWMQYQRLLHSPALFFRDLFLRRPLAPVSGLYFSGASTYPEELEFAVVTKLMAPFNIISQGNYYINVVLFSFCCFWGAYLLYKLLCTQFNSHRTVLAIAVFLFLPAVFWVSGIRGEGFLLLSTGILLYYFQQWLMKPRITNSLLCIVAFALLLIVRNAFALTVLPALAAWWLADRKKTRSWPSFAGVYAVLAALVIASTFLPASFNILEVITKRQQTFFALHGNTRFNLTPLQGNIGSFLLVAPEALVNTLLRPWPWEAKGAMQWLVVLENIAVAALLLICFIRFRQNIRNVFTHPLAWVLFCVTVSNYLLVGYVVPFPGAIVRYRAVPELLLLCLLAVVIAGKSERREIISN